jgi:hypothetical protein
MNEITVTIKVKKVPSGYLVIDPREPNEENAVIDQGRTINDVALAASRHVRSEVERKLGEVTG